MDAHVEFCFVLMTVKLLKVQGITLGHICLLCYQLLLVLNKLFENCVAKMTKINLPVVVPVSQEFEQGTVQIALVSSMMSDISDRGFEG